MQPFHDVRGGRIKRSGAEGEVLGATENSNARGSDETAPLLPSEDPKEDASRSFCDPYSYFRLLLDSYGYRLILLLFVVQHCQKGFANSFSGAATPYLYKTYQVPAPQVQIYASVTGLPWVMKPIIGFVSDVLPVRGYNKAPYMFTTSLLSTVACLILGVMPHGMISMVGLVICLFTMHLQFSTCDLLSEAKYAEKIRNHPENGPALITYVWSGMQGGVLLATLISGPVINAFGPKLPYIVAAVLAMAVLIPLGLGYLEEEWSSPEEVRKVWQRYYEQKEACALCFLMFGSGIALACCGLFSGDPAINASVAVVVGVVVLLGFSLVLSPVIAKFNAFSLIQGALSLSTSGAAFYFFTDTKEQYPEGPHFTPFFYNSVMGTGGAVCSLLGIYLYQRYMSSWKYRHLIIFTNVVASVLGSLDLVMFARLNVKIGIPDHVFILGLSAVETVIWQWQWMPQVVILSYMCPKGMEATMYALLAGCANLGNSISSNCGALLLQHLGCRPSGQVGESEQFKNFWVASAIAVVLPLLAVLLLQGLIPDARQNEGLFTDVQCDATSGSLWRKYVARA